jgi:hypothetical protein
MRLAGENPTEIWTRTSVPNKVGEPVRFLCGDADDALDDIVESARSMEPKLFHGRVDGRLDEDDKGEKGV